MYTKRIMESAVQTVSESSAKLNLMKVEPDGNARKGALL